MTVSNGGTTRGKEEVEMNVKQLGVFISLSVLPLVAALLTVWCVCVCVCVCVCFGGGGEALNGALLKRIGLVKTWKQKEWLCRCQCPLVERNLTSCRS